jgi:hypothetical protein
MCVIIATFKVMKRLFPTSLALLLVMGSLGHVFAAAFCPRMLGHDCCLTRTASFQHPSQSHQHMQGMAMDGMAGNSMQMDGIDMSGLTMEGPLVAPSSLDNQVNQLAGSNEWLSPNRIEEPLDGCTHCMSHSGLQNAPISSVRLPDQSNRDLGSALLPVPGFLTRPAVAFAQIGLPREHAPPGSSAPRHLLINVFLI